MGWNVLILISLLSLRLMWLFRCCLLLLLLLSDYREEKKRPKVSNSLALGRRKRESSFRVDNQEKEHKIHSPLSLLGKLLNEFAKKKKYNFCLLPSVTRDTCCHVYFFYLDLMQVNSTRILVKCASPSTLIGRSTSTDPTTSASTKVVACFHPLFLSFLNTN